MQCVKDFELVETVDVVKVGIANKDLNQFKLFFEVIEEAKVVELVENVS